MSLPRGLHLPIGGQTLQPILADRLQYHQALLPAVLLSLLQQALVHERGDCIQYLLYSIAIARHCADCLRCFQSTATDKDGEPPEEPLLFCI